MDVRQFVERGYSPYEKRFDMVTREEGSGFGASVTLGLSLAIAICFHDIPEGRLQNRQYAG